MNNSCKGEILQIIQDGLTANRQADYCTCQYSHRPGDMCVFCRIENALQQANKCIVSSLIFEKEMDTKMRIVQREIEAKLRALIGGENV